MRRNQRHAPAILLVTFLLASICAASSEAQDAAAWNEQKTKSLDSFLTTLAEQKEFNGAVLLAEDGKVVYEKYLGHCNINGGTKLDARSSFRLASVSKQFTAMAIMILKEQGKLDFDDDIRKHLPTLPYEGITIRHLLHHNSGLPDYESWFEENWDTDKSSDSKKTAFNKDVVEQFSKSKPPVEFAPGESHSYSNSGYVVLGHIVEQASGVSVGEFFQKQIFDPLEMKDSQAFVPNKEFLFSQRVFGFAYKADGVAHEDNDWNFLNGMIGDGGIYASARDMLKWDQSWYGEKLVSQKTIAEAYTSGKTNDGSETGYGFGLGIEKDDDGNLIGVGHNGGWVGFATSLDRDLKNRRTAILLTNNSGDGFGSVKSALRKLANGEELSTPRKKINYELAEVIESKGVQAAVARYKEIEESRSEKFLITDSLIESLADHYREEGQQEIGDQIESLVTKRAKVTLTEQELDALVGTYDISEDFQIKITRRGKRLFGQATGQSEFSLKPTAKNRARVVEIDAEISFTKDENGNTVSLTLHQNGRDMVASKSLGD
jgi:CubicO group peptidase (beta-lactamase class C family)